MITLYLPKDKHFGSILDTLTDDLKSKKNIKTPINRKNTIDAVTNLINMVKDLWKECKQDKLIGTYNEGLLLLSGVIDNGELISKIIIPPNEIQSCAYINSSVFDL